VALLFDDEAGWSMTRGVKPHNELSYGRTVRDWHRAFWRRDIGIDIVPPWVCPAARPRSLLASAPKRSVADRELLQQFR
jgi:hypothetical protein